MLYLTIFVFRSTRSGWLKVHMFRLKGFLFKRLLSFLIQLGLNLVVELKNIGQSIEGLAIDSLILRSKNLKFFFA